MKILPNASKYKKGEMKGKPAEGMETTVSEKQSSELLLRSNEISQMRKTNSPRRILDATISLTSSFKLVNKPGDYEVRSDMSDDGDNSEKQNIDVAEMEEELKTEVEDEDILDAVLEEWMELNPDKKVEIAQRKISVHQPVMSAQKRMDLPLLQKRFSALGLKEELIPPLMADKALDSFRHISQISSKRQMSKFKQDKGLTGQSRMKDDSQSEESAIMEGEPDLRRERSQNN